MMDIYTVLEETMVQCAYQRVNGIILEEMFGNLLHLCIQEGNKTIMCLAPIFHQYRKKLWIIMFNFHIDVILNKFTDQPMK